VSLIATVVSDLVWYWAASKSSIDEISSWKRIARHKELFRKISEHFDEHSLKVLFFSKFVYGTRILVQAMCGLRRVALIPYLTVNILGSATYLSLLYILALGVSRSVATRLVGELKIAIILFLAAVIIVQICIRHFAMKKIFQ